MKKYFYIFVLVFGIFNAQLPDISFNGTNAWTTGTGIAFDTANNQLTITGSSSNRKTILAKTFTVPATVYFIADVWLENTTFTSYNINNPYLLVSGSGLSKPIRFNIDEGLQGTWFKAGIRIDNYSGTDLQFEFGMNKASGTMKVKNPVLSTTEPAFTYEFPWTVPSDVTTTLNVSTTQKHTFQNDLLSSNTHFIFAKEPWSSLKVQTPINTYFPMSNLRFPGGTVGNYYKYTTDNFYISTNPATPNNLVSYTNDGNTLDYTGYKNFCISSGASSTYMLNVMLGTAQTSIAEYQNRYSSGLPMKWVELGNEMYLNENQQGTNVTDASNYITHTKTITTGIKNANPNAKVAVCVDKDDFTAGSWNQTLSGQSYYDAATLHNYNATGVYFFNKFASYAMLKFYKISTDRFTQYNDMFPNKPLLLTEWGITSNVDNPYFIEVLGCADAFLAIEKANQLGIVQQAGTHMLYKNDVNSEGTLMYYNGTKLMLTSRGKMYSKLYEVFKNSEVYNAETVSSELETGLKAVNARVVKNGTNYKIFAVNKLPVSSPLTLNIDGIPYSGSYTLETYTADMSTPTAGIVASSNSWTTTTGTAKSASSSLASPITLPASSIVVITIPVSNVLASNEANINNDAFGVYPNPASDKVFIKYPKKFGNTLSAEIYDATGRKVLEGKVSSENSVGIEKLKKGIYILKLISGSDVVSLQKLIKK